MIENAAPEEVPPPGLGVLTLIVAEPTAVKSAVGIVAVRLVVELNVVTSGCELKSTTERSLNPVPVTVMSVSGEPDTTEVGEIATREAAGLTTTSIADPDFVGSALLTAVNVTVLPPEGIASGAV